MLTLMTWLEVWYSKIWIDGFWFWAVCASCVSLIDYFQGHLALRICLDKVTATLPIFDVLVVPPTTNRVVSIRAHGVLIPFLVDSDERLLGDVALVNQLNCNDGGAVPNGYSQLGQLGSRLTALPSPPTGTGT